MEKYFFENQGTHTFLVYTVGEEDVIDSMSLGMLTNNKIPGLAPALFTQMDTTKYIKYNVSAHISVKQFFSGPVNKKRLIGVFTGIVDAMLSAEDYMIDTASIVLDLDYIFADVSTCETVLICLPVVSDDLANKDLGAFFKNIMFTTQFDQTENCDHVAKIMNYLNSSPVFSLTEFKELLSGIDTVSIGQPMGAMVPPAAPQQPPVQPAPQQPPVQPAQPAPQQPPVQPAQPVRPVQQPPVQPVQPVRPVQQPPVQPVQPVRPVQQPPVQPAPQQPQNQEKKISMFGLLMHYSKENAALYKAQKEAEKNGTPMPANPAGQPAPAPGAFAAPGKPAPAPAPGAFAVPGKPAPAPAPGAFAVPGKPAPAPAPGKPAPAPAPGGFAVPGQPAPAPGAFAVPGKPAQPPVQPVQPAQPVRPVQQPPVQPAAPAPAFNPAPAPQGQPMNFGETTVLGGGGGIGETTVLGAASAAVVPKPHLIRMKNNEKINLDKPVYRIGKEKSYVDYFIGDNSAISRSHANIISRDGAYFVVDTNSTNHTYLNGVMLQSNVESKVVHGDKIRLANEDFEFKLY